MISLLFLTMYLSLLFHDISAIVHTSRSLDKDSSAQTMNSCPTWYFHAQDDSERCICGDTLNGEIRCQEREEKILLVLSSCITYTGEQVLVSVCPYSPLLDEPRDDFYYEVPSNLSEIVDFMCSPLNRTGLLCSECQEGLSLAAMSYRRQCVNCSNPTKGVFLFLVLSTIPTTAFFLLVMFCNIDVSSGSMNAILVSIHIAFTMINETPALYLLKSNKSWLYYPSLILMTLYGIWNLDFFRYIIPPFCISKSLTPLQAEALEYVVAVYPLLLIIITYTSVELYDNEYRIMVILCAPFKRLFKSKFFNDLNIKHSLIKAFATFLLLSFTKIFNISRTLLDSTEAKNITGDSVETLLTIDASTSYFSSTHIPYVVLAIFMLVAFNLIPLLLLFFYPLKWFQCLLGKFSGVNWHPLRAFMDIFQGCYKNGTDGTRDCRYFAALNLLLRMLLLIPIDARVNIGVRITVELTVFIALLAIARPYRRNIFNNWEIFIYSSYVIVAILVMGSSFSAHRLFLEYCIPVIIHVYICIVFGGKFLQTFSPRCYNTSLDKLAAFIKKTSFPCCCYHQEVSRVREMEQGCEEISEADEDYPDRVNNPQDYEPLLAPGQNPSSNQCTPVLTYGIIENI